MAIRSRRPGAHIPPGPFLSTRSCGCRPSAPGPCLRGLSLPYRHRRRLCTMRSGSRSHPSGSRETPDDMPCVLAPACGTESMPSGRRRVAFAQGGASPASEMDPGGSKRDPRGPSGAPRESEHSVSGAERQPLRSHGFSSCPRAVLQGRAGSDREWRDGARRRIASARVRMEDASGASPRGTPGGSMSPIPAVRARSPRGPDCGLLTYGPRPMGVVEGSR